MSLLNHLYCMGTVYWPLLETESVWWCSIGCLTPTKPLKHTGNISWESRLQVVDVLHLGCMRVRFVNGKNLPIKLTIIIKHGKGTKNVDSHNVTLVLGTLPSLHNIQRVMVTKSVEHGMFDSGVLPILGK